MSWERAGRLAWIAPLLTVAFEVAYYTIAVDPEEGDEGVDILFGLTFQPAHISLWLRSPR